MREAISSSKVDQSRKLEKPIISELPAKAESVEGSPKVNYSSIATNDGNLLTTGEAYEVLKGRGFDKSVGTFRRWLADALRSGSLPDVLTQYGLSADFTTRRSANPKDNSIKWLYFK